MFTDNTNSRNLELYSIIAKHDNTGYPLSYCLPSGNMAIACFVNYLTLMPTYGFLFLII